MKPLRSTQFIDDSNVLEDAISAVANAVADSSRVSILCALMDGRAWTATELSSVANIAPSTASSHLAKLLHHQLISCLSQGRHRYYRLAGPDIAALLETLMGVSIKRQPEYKTKTPANLRKARTCYDHLAGESAVEIYELMVAQGWIQPDGNGLSDFGRAKFAALGAVIDPCSKRKSACACLDWSERRFHLGGAAGAALLEAFEKNGWINRMLGYREITFTESGKRALKSYFSYRDNI